MPTVEERSEERRGCGFRKPGGLYMVSPPLTLGCPAMPVELHRCPTCDAGMKPTRAWTWVDADKLLPIGPHGGDIHNARCPLSGRDPLGKAGLIWVGGAYYPTPSHFTEEAAHQGVSRRIAAIPRDFELGETWVLLAHRDCIPNPAFDTDPNEDREHLPGIFSVYRPTAIEYVVRGDEKPEKLEGLEKRGVTLVKVKPIGKQAEIDDYEAGGLLHETESTA